MNGNTFIYIAALTITSLMIGCKDINPANDGGGNNTPNDTTQNNPDTPTPSDPTVVDVSDQLTGNTSKGRLSGVFSVADKYWVYTGGDTGHGGWDTKTSEGKVRFSQGNLMYLASENLWRFADTQLETIGDYSNSLASELYNHYIDLFYFGTSGWDNTAEDTTATHYQPWSREIYNLPTYDYIQLLNCVDNAFETKCDTAHNYFVDLGYGPLPPMGDGEKGEDLDGVWSEAGYIDIKTLAAGKYRNYDWGWYNKIANGGNKEHMWRVLTYREWNYILSGRPNAEYLKCNAVISGNGAVFNGVILMPDDFVPSDDIRWEWNAPYKSQGDTYWSQVEYTMEEWLKLEAKGGVFLPGYFTGYSGDAGYHSSCHFIEGGVDWRSGYRDHYYTMQNSLARVRLVQDVTDESPSGENDPDPVIPSHNCENLSASYLATGGTGLGEMNVNEENSWAYNSKYGAVVSYSYGSAWLYTPVLDLRGMKSVTISFQHALNYCSYDYVGPGQTLWVTKDFDGGFYGQNWKQITIPNYPNGNNWTYVSNTIDIPVEYVGEFTVFAFQYYDDYNDNSNWQGTLSNWEIKNLKINAVCADN